MLNTNENEFVLSIEDKITSIERQIEWKSINGFIFDDLYIFLFVDNHVYVFIDPFLGNHRDMRIELGFTRFTYQEMFECRTESIPKLADSVLGPKEIGGENRKLYLLYGIFILHFLAAFFMITTVIINRFDFYKTQWLSTNSYSTLNKNSIKE